MATQSKLNKTIKDLENLKNPGGGDAGKKYRKSYDESTQGLQDIIDRLNQQSKSGRKSFNRYERDIKSNQRRGRGMLKSLKGEYDSSFTEQKDWLKSQFADYEKAVQEARGNIREYESGSGSSKQSSFLSRNDISQALADMRKANEGTGQLAEQFKERAGEIDKLGADRRADFQALGRDLLSGPSVVQAQASRERQRQLADRARLINSFSGSGTSQSVSDYLNQVETADQTALAETASARANEYYQRRQSYQKALSAQVVSDNYYQSLSREAMTGALSAYQGQADVNARIAEATLMESNYRNNQLATEGNLVTGLYGDKLRAINDLYQGRQQSLGTYGGLATQVQGQNLQSTLGLLQAKNQQRSTNIQALSQAGQFASELADKDWRAFESQRDFERRKVQEDRAFLQSFANQLNTQISREVEQSRLDQLGQGYSGFMQSIA